MNKTPQEPNRDIHAPDAADKEQENENKRWCRRITLIVALVAILIVTPLWLKASGKSSDGGKTKDIATGTPKPVAVPKATPRSTPLPRATPSSTPSPAPAITAPVEQIAVALPDYGIGDQITVILPFPKLAGKDMKEVGTELQAVVMTVRACNEKRMQLFQSPSGKFDDWKMELDWAYGNPEDKSGTFTMRGDKKQVIMKATFQVGFVQLPGQQKPPSKTAMVGWMKYSGAYDHSDRRLTLALAKRAEAEPGKTAANQ